MAKRKAVALVLRHGDTDANDDNVYRSRLDPPLNAKGRDQAEDAVEYIKETYDVDRIVSSPLLRALETADICGDALDLEVEQDRGLISWALGFLSGKDKDLYGFILEWFVDNPDKVPPEGESLDDLEERTEDFFDYELKHRKGVTLYVTHSSNILTLGNLFDEDATGRQETEELVGPGGVMVVYETEDGYELEAVFGKEVRNEFGS
jgi:broad specificity phosphatase PhoE